MKENISIRKHSGIYTLTVKQALPITLDEAWEFFSSPVNLSRITPAGMGFKITSGEPPVMYRGQIITYKIGLLPRIKTNWVTEITQVGEGKYFVDEQRFGPYKMWHHAHHFEPTDDGVIMTDNISYKLPFGIFGHLAHPLLVKPKLLEIFAYRLDVLEKLFGSGPISASNSPTIMAVAPQMISSSIK